jgi:hypothetical protein
MADTISLHRFLSLIDPPKDLAIASTDPRKSLSNRDHHAQIKTAIFNLFGTGNITTTNTFLTENGIKKYKAVGDDKEKLSKRIRTVYKYYFDDQRDMIQVLIKAGSPTGYYPLPQGYNIIQDNYGGKCTTNPNYIITPASLIDPCNRKHNEDNLVEGETIEEIMNYSLDMNTIQAAALDTCINGPITCENAGEKWKITIPLVDGGPLELLFNKETHLEQGTDYTSGNPHKNQKIFELLQGARPNLSKVELYILVKELGDFLQVLWVNVLIANNNKFTSANTIVCTSDSIVLYRCIISGIGCIFKESKLDTATYYLPNIAKGPLKMAMEQQTIMMIRNEVNSNNIAVIQLMEEVLEKRLNEGMWVGDTNQWKPESVANAKAFLVRYIEELKNINADLMVKFGIITDLAVITELAAKSTFQCPFKKTKEGGYGLIINVTSLFSKDRSRLFRATFFTPASFSREEYPNPRIQMGGAPLMTFDRRILILLAVILAILVTGHIFRPDLFLRLSALIIPRQRQILTTIAAALGITEGVERFFDRGPGATGPLYNGIAAAGRVIGSALPRPACSPSRPIDPRRLSIITKTEAIVDNLQGGRDPGNEIIRKVMVELSRADPSREEEIRQETIDILTRYISLIQEAEGCLIQTEAYRDDREFLLYYAEEAATKMVEAAITVRLFGDFLSMGRVETEVGTLSARRSPAKPPPPGFVILPKNLRMRLLEGGARHPILDYPGNIDKPGFLFCYAREMHQELFTYGYYMRLGFGASIEDSICSQYLAEEGDYEFMKNGEFVLHAELKNPDELLEKTRELLIYSQVFLEEYPLMIKDESVTTFFDHLNLPKPEVSPLALQAAMDFYSAYYNIARMATYQKKEHSDYLMERLELLGHYEMLIEQNPENELYKFESNYFYREAMSIASVSNAFEKIQEAIITPSPVKIKKSPMAIAARGGTRKLKKKQGRKTRSRK